MKNIQEILETSGSTRIIQKDSCSGKQWIIALTDQQKRKVFDRKQINEIASLYYETLYTSKLNDKDKEKLAIELNQENIIPPVLREEILYAIKMQNNNRSPGEDKIRAEHLKIAANELAPSLTNIFNEVLQTKVIPESWCSSTIILLHKKGPKTSLDNYRPVSLLPVIYKIFISIILRRLATKLDENQPIEQAGFRKDFSTIDHLQTINQILEKHKEYNMPLYMCFVDYKKAFDSLEHPYIFSHLNSKA